ncbi:hypothetical protein E3N88_27967 [Mikania micrantha]|uniref:WAT1-related protein n=1 Tax=Mikania micrantha TaxID=192012 RepID=A0A5N6MZ64_9ASTR|nr:hypothetical protein E3N88_27967 [Mikania micrantha]
MQRLKATLMMVAAEVVIAGFTVSYKLAAADGMHMRVLITYRYLFASILIFPLALYLERNERPKLTWTILFQVFLCATFGGPVSQNMYAKSLVLTSATFVAAFTNLIPPFTFIVAVLFRLEKVEIGKIRGKAKVVGTLIGVGGAMLLTFYKGHQLKNVSTHFNLLHYGNRQDGHVTLAHKTSSHDHIFGSILALAYSLFVAFYYMVQSKLSVNYPCHYSNTFLFSVFGFIQSLVYVALTERSQSEWKLNSNIRLFAAIFQSKETKRLSKLTSLGSPKHMNNVPSNTMNALETMAVASRSFSGDIDEGDELHGKSLMGKHKEQEVINEEV